MALSPSTIFSPSVARQQLATTKDWNHIDAWLTRHFSPRSPPSFERTPETLKALLTLSSLNESADEARDLLHQSTLHSISILKDQEKAPISEEVHSEKEILRSLEESLTREGNAALEALTGLSLLLSSHGGDFQSHTEDIAQKIINLQVQEFDILQAAQRTEVLRHYLNTEATHLEQIITSLETNPSYHVSSDLTKRIVDWNRRTKILAAKIPELQKQVSSLESSQSRSSSYPTIQEIVAEERRFKELMKEVKQLEVEVKGFHGLPQDTDLARLEVEGVRQELRELVVERDRLFEGLVERETPRRKGGGFR